MLRYLSLRIEIEVRNITKCDYSIWISKVNELCKIIYIKLRKVSIIT